MSIIILLEFLLQIPKLSLTSVSSHPLTLLSTPSLTPLLSLKCSEDMPDTAFVLDAELSPQEKYLVIKQKSPGKRILT